MRQCSCGIWTFDNREMCPACEKHYEEFLQRHDMIVDLGGKRYIIDLKTEQEHAMREAEKAVKPKRHLRRVK